MLTYFTTLVAASAVSFLPAVGASALVKRTTPVLPSCTDFTPFTYAGCFNDPSNPSALLFRAVTLDSQNMTINTCVAFCKGNGYRYAGLEYYGICFCGSSVTGTQIDESQCNYPCTGDKTEVCGGTDIISVYQDPTFPPVGDVTDISDYKPIGCYSEGPYGRTLNWKQDEVDGASLTVEECLLACKQEAYAFAGVEYGTECWCGVVLANGTQPLPLDACDFPCTGNPDQACGGDNKLNLYVATDLESREPCKNEPPPVSSSTTAVTTTPTTTPSTTPSTTPTTTPTTTPSTTPYTTTAKPTTESTTTAKTTTPSTTTAKTTTSVSICTTTTVIPPPAPTCEYKCGKWCSTPLPPFTNKNDCKVAVTNCAIQLTSCFLQAGWPDSLNCFKYSSWCDNINTYCTGSCPGAQCSWASCKSKYPPSYPPTLPTPITSTSTYLCPATTTKATTTKSATASTTTTSTCVPVPTHSCICDQPNNPYKGYSSDSPVAGIKLPCLTCNNLKSDYSSGNIFKLYNDPDSSKCPSYPKPSVPSGCKKACDNQYSACVNVYAEDCRGNTRRAASPWGERGIDGRKRTFGDSYSSAMTKCKNQWQDCYAINGGKNDGGKCSVYNGGW